MHSVNTHSSTRVKIHFEIKLCYDLKAITLFDRNVFSFIIAAASVNLTFYSLATLCKMHFFNLYII